MKSLYTLMAILMMGISVKAQNWQCMQPGQKVYFTNSSSHYLRGMRIDSVHTSGSTITYFPFRSPRGPFANGSILGPTLDTLHGGSWLGKTVTQLSDGTTLFSNTRNDTVIIKTAAPVGAQWVFYNDTASVYYMATVVSDGTANILGASDSVKTISITAMQGSNVLSTDPLSQYSIVLSKAHGLAQVFDLYNFPYQKSTSQGGGPYADYYVCKNLPTDTGAALFRRVDLQLPACPTFFNYAAGDVLQYSLYDGSSGLGAPTLGTLNDTVAAKQVNASSTLYTLHCRRVIETGIGSFNGPVFTTTFFDTTLLYPNAYYPLMDTGKMPEEWHNSYFYYYDNADTTFCSIGPKYRKSYAYIDTNGRVNTFEPCGETDSTLKTGLGLLYTYHCLEPITGYGTGQTLLFIRKNGQPCGNYSNLAVSNVSPGSSVLIAPNPASEMITLLLPSSVATCRITVTDLLGRQRYHTVAPGSSFAVDVRSWPSGVYLVELRTSAQTWTRKIMVQH